MAAGLATLELLAVPGFHADLAAKTSQLCDGLVMAAHAAEIPLTTHAVGGMFGFFFTGETVTSYAQAIACDVERFKRFFHGMLAEGVYLAPSAFEAGFMSAAHTEVEIAATLSAAQRVLAGI